MDSDLLLKAVQVNVKLTFQQKRKLQNLANKNSDGDVTALIKMLINGSDIKHENL
jgi:hypothetical protein